jgi:hypothetical protein
MEPDRELQNLIHRWTPPVPSGDLDRRMLERYRGRRGWRGMWTRFIHARLSVPVPALAVGAALLVIVWFAVLSRSAGGRTDPMAGFEPVANPQLIVERAEVRQ